MNRWVQQFLFAVVLAAIAPATWACAICAPAQGQDRLTSRLFAADIAVLATATHGGVAFRVLETIKGDPPKGLVEVRDAAAMVHVLPANAALLLLYSAGTQSWRAVGPLGAARADWARRLVSMRGASETPEAAWAQRVAFFAADLESPEPLVAQTAYEEIAVAPYSAMRTLKPGPDEPKLTRWLDLPDLAARRPLYTLLLGMVGSEATAAALAQRLLASSRLQSAAEVSAMLAAYLEIRGSSGVAWLEQHYLLDMQRSELEVQAALMALSVHGNDGARVSRERVVQAYARFIRANGRQAGLVASDLGNWEHWEFGPEYVALLKSGAPQVFSSRYAMVFYLMRSPKPEAGAALAALRADGVL